MDQDELQNFKNVVDKEDHCRNQRLNRLEQAFNAAQNDPCEENSRQKTYSVPHALQHLLWLWFTVA